MNKLVGEARVQGKPKQRKVDEAKGTEVDILDGAVGMGFENVTARDLLVPRLVIAQKLSPQLKAQDGAYIEGAKEGMICDTGASKAYAQVEFLPVLYKKSWIEWAPRNERRGVVHVYDTPQILDRCTKQGNKWMLGQNSIAETAQFYGFRVDATDHLQPCFVAMPSSQLKAAKKWLHMAMSSKVERADGTRVQPPLWYFSYLLSTIEQSNAEGSWYGWQVTRQNELPTLAKMMTDDVTIVADQCKTFHHTIAQGLAKPNFAEQVGQSEYRQIEGDTNRAEFDDEVPF